MVRFRGAQLGTSFGATHWRREGPGLAAAAVVCLATVTSISWTPHPVLVWNASASSPQGLYLVSSAHGLHRGEWALAWPPAQARRLAARRHYLPAGVPLVKKVAAIAGDRVCAYGATIRINGHVVAIRNPADPSGRPLPRWSGCTILREGQAMLLGTSGPHSFDGRYFGTSDQHDILGSARRL